MRILGPNGEPLESVPAVSEEVRQIVERAKAIAAQGDPGTALQQMVYAFQQDVSSDFVLDTTCDLLKQIMQAAGAQQSDELQMFEHLKNHRDDPTIYYQVGNRFFQLQQPFVALPFLTHAKQLLGDTLNDLSQAVDVDYSQVLMDLGGYEEAIAAFHQLNEKFGGLPIWLVMEMAECYALLRQVDEAEAVYQIAPTEAAAQFEGMEAVREEVGDLLARVRDFEGDEQMGLRAWHYVQTRGIVLETAPEEMPGERFILFPPNEEDIAYIIGTTAAILDQRGYAPNRILWLGDSSEPLARLFAQWWEMDNSNIRPYQPGDNTDDEENMSLLVMAHSTDVMGLPDEATFVDLAQARAGLITFALDLRWTERQPMTPDIAGFMSQICYLPWEAKVEVDGEQMTVTPLAERPDPQQVAEALAGQFPEEQECDDFAKEIMAEYEGCTDLILDHRDGSLIRRPLVAHSPVKSPRMGF